jgi:PAS domain S-box-containing protein
MKDDPAAHEESMAGNQSKQFSPGTILTGTIIVSSLPYLVVMLFPSRLHFVMDSASYLLFHNIAEFFSIMVSLSIFGVGWHTYRQSKDRHALFLSAAFLSIGLMDFMHTMAGAAMPAFITPNSTNKSAQFWIAIRFVSALAFLVSAHVYKERQISWLPKAAVSKTTLLVAALAVPALIFIGITFYPSHIPAAFVEGVGLTAFKIYSEYLTVCILCLAAAAYWRRMKRTGDGLLMYYVAAFIVCVFSELVFTAYKIDFDIYNVLGHIYKIAAFYLIYRGIFVSSVRNPYVELSCTNERLDGEIIERKEAEEALEKAKEGLEQRVKERTADLADANSRLRVELAERQRAEDAARESEERLRFALETIHIGAWDLDLVDHTAFRSLEHDRIFGYAEPLSGWTYEMFLEHVVPEDRAEVDDKFRRAMEHTSDWSFECRIRRADGLIRWIWAVGRHTPDAQGAPRRMAGIVQDITDRKHAEEELRRSRDELELRVQERTEALRRQADLIELSHEAIIVRDLESRILFWSKGAEETYGWTKAEAQGNVTHSFLKTKWPVSFDEHMAVLVREGRWEGELIHTKKDGSRLTVLSRHALQRDEAGAAVAILEINIDITERKKAEDETKKYAARLEASNRELQDFAFVASHDLQEPLRKIQAFGDQLKIGCGASLDLEGIDYLNRMQSAAARMQALIQALLHYSRVTTRAKPFLPTDLSQAAHGAVGDLVERIRETEGLVDVEELATIDADFIQMGQLFQNLIGNALRFHGKERPVVKIYGRMETHPDGTPDGKYTIFVEDNGIGFEEKYLDRIFIPFQRLHGRGAYEGTGIGLAICRKIVDRHNGSITAKSMPGKGTTFMVSLPVKQSKGERNER